MDVQRKLAALFIILLMRENVSMPTRDSFGAEKSILAELAQHLSASRRADRPDMKPLFRFQWVPPPRWQPTKARLAVFGRVKARLKEEIGASSWQLQSICCIRPIESIPVFVTTFPPLIAIPAREGNKGRKGEEGIIIILRSRERSSPGDPALFAAHPNWDLPLAGRQSADGGIGSARIDRSALID